MDIDSTLYGVISKQAILDEQMREYIKFSIEKLMINNISITDNIFDKVIGVNDISTISYQQMFTILLFNYRKLYGQSGLQFMINKYGLDDPVEDEKELKYEITNEDIEYIFMDEYIELSIEDKVKIAAQLLYQHLFGLEIIDDIVYMNVEKIYGGTSKDCNSFSIWIKIMDKDIKLSCFDNMDIKEIREICNKLSNIDEPLLVTNNNKQMRGIVINNCGKENMNFEIF